MDEFERSLNSLLVDTFNSILKLEEIAIKALSGLQITIGEVHIIELVGKSGRISAGDIASALGISPPSATVAVKKLIQKGFVIKTPCQADARRFFISLTALGQKIFNMHDGFHHKMVKNVSKGFSDAERDVLLTAVERLNEFFRKKVDAL